MATKEDFISNVNNLSTTVTELGSKLEAIQSLVESLKAGQVLTQEELDSLNDTVSSAQSTASEASSRADSILA